MLACRMNSVPQAHHEPEAAHNSVGANSFAKGPVHSMYLRSQEYRLHE